jgi:LysR family transcriptional regulator, hydrogen peroxide-inducible genes activator
MEIYQLRYFVNVAEAGNFTRAAEKSNISQPSLSQQILNLEEEVGKTLFHRLGRKVTLTEEGQILLEHARRIIGEADNALRELKEDSSRGHRVAVGAIPTVAHFFFPAVVAHCRANDVRIKLRSFEAFTAAIVSAVAEGELDWGVIAQAPGDARLEVRRLYSEPLLVVLGEGHPLAAAPAVRFGDLRDENFIMLGDASSLTALVRRLGGENEFEPRITHRCAQITTVKSLTAMGLGVSVLPRSTRNATDPAGLVYRKFDGPTPSRDVLLIRHRRRHVSRGAQLFAEAAHAVVGPPDNTAAPFPR